MADKFRFSLLTKDDPQAQYDAITTKDSLTFYLLSNGIGYLGETKLFDATDNSLDSSLVTDMLADDFVADDKTAASTKAIVDYVADQVGNISTVLTTSFFRKVESHTLTEEDLANTAISVPEGAAANDVGLLFTADTDSEDGGESYYFISLMNYLQTVYSFESTNSIEINVADDNKVTANLKIKNTETSLKIDEENGGVYLEKATAIDEDAPSADKLITEAVLVDYIQNSVLTAVDEAITEALADVVTYTVDENATT